MVVNTKPTIHQRWVRLHCRLATSDTRGKPVSDQSSVSKSSTSSTKLSVSPTNRRSSSSCTMSFIIMVTVAVFDMGLSASLLAIFRFFPLLSRQVVGCVVDKGVDGGVKFFHSSIFQSCEYYGNDDNKMYFWQKVRKYSLSSRKRI